MIEKMSIRKRTYECDDNDDKHKNRDIRISVIKD